jgi:hypothetical protein
MNLIDRTQASHSLSEFCWSSPSMHKNVEIKISKKDGPSSSGVDSNNSNRTHHQTPQQALASKACYGV